MKKYIMLMSTCFLFISFPLFAFEGDNCICTLQYAPVCGVDGVTYGNKCALDCEKVELAHKGECGTAIPATCTSRYDGCNTCGVEHGEITACTEMACFVQEEPKCLAYDFVHVTKVHEVYIQEVVDAYFSALSLAEREAATETILAKIQAKRDAIQYTLATSSFVVGSPLLKKYELHLEILTALEIML